MSQRQRGHRGTEGHSPGSFRESPVESEKKVPPHPCQPLSNTQGFLYNFSPWSFIDFKVILCFAFSGSANLHVLSRGCVPALLCAQLLLCRLPPSHVLYSSFPRETEVSSPSSVTPCLHLLRRPPKGGFHLCFLEEPAFCEAGVVPVNSMSPKHDM